MHSGHIKVIILLRYISLYYSDAPNYHLRIFSWISTTCWTTYQSRQDKLINTTVCLIFPTGN